MTILDRVNKKPDEEQKPEKQQEAPSSTESQVANVVQSQFEKMMEEFRANAGFSVDTGEQPVSTMIELLSSKWVNLPIIVLLAYIRYCINHGLKKDITVKIGYNKPASVPMNFAVNEEMIEEHYPSDVVEIN
jgi:hypothetical protein